MITYTIEERAVAVLLGQFVRWWEVQAGEGKNLRTKDLEEMISGFIRFRREEKS